MAKDNFSAQAKAYATFRPKLPAALYEFVFSHVQCFDLAWDAGTGNGQAAAELAKVFQQVVATDISEHQLAQAVSLPNIIYKNERAESPSLDDQSVDLITIAQAIHWFDFDQFYNAVNRVAKPGAVIAAFSYSMFNATNKEIDQVIQQFYKASAPYWDEERKYVDEQYQAIPFPYQEIDAPVFYIDYEWTVDQLLGYINTWSANQHCIRKTGNGLVTGAFRSLLEELSSPGGMIALRFPVYMRIGRI